MKLDKVVLANTFALATTILRIICSLFVVLLPNLSMVISKWWMHGQDLTLMGDWKLDLANLLLGGLTLVISAWTSGYIFGWSWEKLSQ